MNLSTTYNGKKVFLTGHTGFKGSWLLIWLHQLGAHVRGYSMAPLPEHKLYEHINGNDFCDSVFNDVLNYHELESNVLGFEPDFIFHLAAQPIVKTSYDIPVETFTVNAIGTANLLNIARRLKNPCVVIVITTDKVYLNEESNHAYNETDKLGGNDPYSASKACAELIVESFRRSFFYPEQYAIHKLALSVARAGNVIGGGDWAKDRILPDIIRALKSNQPVEIRNPEYIRPWQHVLEPLCGYLLLGKKMNENPIKYSTAYNFGPRESDCWTVKEMVRYSIEVWGCGSFNLKEEDKKVHESSLLKLDIGKAERDLLWRPTYSAKEAIKKTINWYREFDGTNALQLILAQIKAFESDFKSSEN